MPEQIILAKDALFISEEHPDCNYNDTGKMKVGFQEYITAICGDCNSPKNSYETIGLIQFAPIKLPPNTRLVQIRLHLFVLRSKHQTSNILIRPLAEPFAAKRVTWHTMPSIAPAPKIPLLIHQKEQCNYVTWDITRAFNPKAGEWGLALSANRKTLDFALFSAALTSYPVYATILYEPIIPPDSMAFERIQNVFRESVLNLEGGGDTLYSENISTKDAQTITFFVKNTGTNPFHFRIQISPDGDSFIHDKQMGTLLAGEMEAFTPYLFAKFMRVCISPVRQGETVEARIYCQIQTQNYVVKD